MSLGVNVEGVSLGIDQAIPCGLIINELVSNSLKHAFGDRGGELRIDLRQREQAIALVISDDGVGLPAEVDVKDSTSLGLKLVNILVGQLKGTMRVDTESGTQFTIEFQRRPVAG